MSRTFSTVEDALAWAEEERARMVTAGWRYLPESSPSNQSSASG
jgi:hypothetical protein